MPRTRKDLIGQDRDVRLLQPGGREDVDDLIGRHRLRDDLPDGELYLFRAAAAVSGALGQHGPHGLEEPHVVPYLQRLLVRNGQRKRLRYVPDRLHEPVLAVILRQNMLLRRREDGQPLPRTAALPRRPVKAVEDSTADLVALQHDRYGLFLVDGGLTLAAALCVVRQGILKLVGKTKIIHHKTAWLVLEHPVYPRDGLHQSMAPHRLVYVHRMEARRVKTRQPHVADDHHLERLLRVLEALCQFLAARLVADV